MLEFSLVQEIFRVIYSHAQKHKATAVTKVVLRFGPLSGIEPYLLKRAFDTFKERTIAGNAELVLNKDGVSIRCRDCETISVEETLLFRCKKCNSVNVEVKDCGDLILERLEMECG
jgi:hydrogenase nickel incorporation protein HypA/HybF